VTAKLRGAIRSLGTAELAIGMLFIILALRAALMTAQVDTFWHLRAGEDIWRNHRVPMVDTYSFTSGGWPWRDHEWLWQPVSYAVFLLGGMPALTLFGAALAIAAMVVAYRLMVGRAWTKFVLIAFVWLPLLPSAWALRPQLVSVLAAPLLLTFLTRERHWPIPLLFLVWANAHGAVALGGVLLMVATVTAFARWRIRRAPEDRRRALALAIVLPLSGLACLATPLGTGMLHFLTDSMARIHAVHIEEWRSAFGAEQLGIRFWVVAIPFVLLAITRRRALRDGHASSWTAWVLVACAVVLLPLTAAAVRNAGSFALIVAAAASHLIGPDGLQPRAPAVASPPDAGRGTINAVILVAMAIAGAGLVARSYRTGDAELGWHPIDDRALAAVRACDGPLYNHYDEGGYLLWFVPEKPDFVDGRQDPFPLEHVLASLDVERGRAPYKPLFDRWGIRCAFLSVKSPTVAALERDGWSTRFRDEKYAVMVAPDPSRQPQTAAPSP
jgi:hypothetical protein